MSIETQADLDGITRVGRVVAQTLRAMEDATRAGITTGELDAIGAGILSAHGARSAPQLVYDCPAQTLISVNDEIVHGLPGRRCLCAGDVVKLDVTAELDGYIADAATTVVLPGGTERARLLRECAIRAFEAAAALARAGTRVSEVGREIESIVVADGFSVLRSLSGHGVGRSIHEWPTVPNYFDPYQRDILTEGLVLTIEPLISERPTAVMEHRDGWTLRTRNGCLAAHYEHTMIITSGTPVIVTESH